MFSETQRLCFTILTNSTSVVLFSFVLPLFLFYLSLLAHCPILTPSQTVSLTILHNYLQIYRYRIYEINTPMPQFTLCHFSVSLKEFSNKACLRTTDLQQEELWLLHRWARKVILTLNRKRRFYLPLASWLKTQALKEDDLSEQLSVTTTSRVLENYDTGRTMGGFWEPNSPVCFENITRLWAVISLERHG